MTSPLITQGYKDGNLIVTEGYGSGTLGGLEMGTNEIISQGYIDNNMIITQGFTIGVAVVPSAPTGGGAYFWPRKAKPPFNRELLLQIKAYLEAKLSASA